MKGIKIGQKLTASFALIGFIAMVIGIVGLTSVNKVMKAGNDLYEHVTIPLTELRSMESLFQRSRVNIRDMVTSNDKQKIAYFSDRAETEINDIDKVVPEFEKTMRTQEEKVIMKEIISALDTYHNDVRQMIALAKENNDQEALESITAGQTYKDGKTAVSMIEKMIDQKVALGEASVKENDVIVKKAYNIILAVLGFGGILTIFLGIFIAGSITRPIKQVVAMIKDIAEGEGDLTKSVKVDSKDEIGELAMWFNVFMEKLHDIIYQVANSTARIASSTQELAATAEEMAAGAEEQTSQTSQVATSMEEMSATVQQVAKNSGFAAEKAKSAGETAGIGNDVVNQTVAGMNKIANSVKDLQSVVRSLTNNSEKIGDVVNVIDDVADQTNLLALNAAIEAARAGEMGRGFAVVADEVRKLAERTTSSTKEIAAMVRSIQEDTVKAAGSMEASTKEVEEGVKLAYLAEASLTQIISGAKSVKDIVQQIATAAEQQSAAAEEISANVESIASVSKQNAASSQQTSVSSQEISKLTDDLQGLIGSFKLKKSVEKREKVNIVEDSSSKFEIINGKGRHRTTAVPMSHSKKEPRPAAAATEK